MVKYFEMYNTVRYKMGIVCFHAFTWLMNRSNELLIPLHLYFKSIPSTCSLQHGKNITLLLQNNLICIYRRSNIRKCNNILKLNST